MSKTDVELQDITRTTTPSTVMQSSSDSPKNNKAKRPPILLEWKDISFKVKIKTPPPPGMPKMQALRWKLFGKQDKIILHPMSGYISPGHVLAIMGPSGAGKTSLLNILAQRVKDYSGEIFCNGEPVGKSFRSLSAFVQQDDVMMGNLTVREVLRYAALLRLPSSISLKEKLQRIDDIMDELGLTGAADTKVGVPGISKGISGGERKRLAIGIELLTEPSVLFLDEPTTGLDAKTALNVMETIRKIAQNGRTVILTIHQPRSDIFTLFDGLLLLARGKTAYSGDARDAKQYFANLGLVCPELYNPADYYIDQITETTSDTLHGKQQRSIDNDRITRILDHYQRNYQDKYISPELDSSLETGLGKFSRYRSSWFTQFFILLSRAFISIIRDRVLTVTRFIQTIAMAVLVGLIYLRLGNGQSNVQDRIAVIFFFLLNQSMGSIFTALTVFLNEDKGVFLRERGSKTYHVSSYYIAKSIAELPNVIFFPILNGCIAYWMIGLNPAPDRFFIFLFLNVVVALTAQSLGMLIGTFSPNTNFAMAMTPLLITLLMLFGGLYINVGNIPPWFVWIYYISMFHYGYEALVINEFQGVTFDCPAAPQPCFYPTGDSVINGLSMNTTISNIWIDVGILFALMIGLKILSYLCLRFIQKPKGG